jgi:uncharacterized protein (TIGR04551 family)
LLIAVGLPAVGWAQSGGQGGAMGPGPEEPKPEGVAEQAPTTPGALPTTPVLPPPRSKRKRFELIELDGYFRVRGDWFKKFHLGFDDLGAGGAPFPRPLACNPTGELDKPCEDTLKSANMRLRLEPTIHLDERTAVHIQADVLDNLVLGSTPVGVYGDGRPRPADVPLGGFTDGQTAPQSRVNGQNDSIVVKRVWAEVETALARIEVGRMPWHWGLGIYANGGSYDPIHASWDLDADYGDTIDRLALSRELTSSLRGTLAMDWGQTAPVSSQSDASATRGGQPWDLDDNDDLNQWTILLTHIDSPSAWKDNLEQGNIGFNYGLHIARRTQSWEQTSFSLTESPDPEAFVPRSLTAYIPDLWVRFAVGALELEAEVIAIMGTMEKVQLADASVVDDLSLRQFGGVGRLGYRVLGGDMKLGREIGYASGDQWDADPQGSVHVSNKSLLPRNEYDTTVNAFLFDPDYKVDLILFRELMGSISNATYLRPSLDYDISDRFRLSGQSVISFDNQRVSTPGNGIMYGVELDADVSYHHNGFTMGIAYGVLFPLGALDHPADSDFDQGGRGFEYGDNAGDAKAAQTIQTRLSVQF